MTRNMALITMDQSQPKKRDRQVDREIDENLKRAFQETAEAPLPDRFTDLLNQLRKSETGGGGINE